MTEGAVSGPTVSGDGGCELAGGAGAGGTESERMLCGCTRAVVAEGGHPVACPAAMIVAEYEGKLARAVGRAPLELAAMSTGTADWSSTEVISEGAILRLDALSLEGVWQRQGDQLVPVVEQGLAELIDTCHERGCGLCARCDEERRYRALRLDALRLVEKDVAMAVAGAQEALREYEYWTANCVGDSFDLGWRDAGDLVSDLESAGRCLRGASRIIGHHIAAMQGGGER